MRQNAEIQAILSLLHPFFHFSHLPIPSHSSALPTPPLKFAPAWKSSIYFCETFFLFLVDLDNITKAHKSVDGWRLRRRAERIWDQHNFIERMRVFRSVEWVRTLLRLTRLRKILSCDRKGMNKMWRGEWWRNFSCRKNGALAQGEVARAQLAYLLFPMLGLYFIVFKFLHLSILPICETQQRASFSLNETVL